MGAEQKGKAAPCSTSIQLLDKDAYESTYKAMKEAHGRRIVKEWTEKTDPAKYVFEDCGIAAYLLELWRQHGIGPRTGGGFADVGCGNGLLAHLLTLHGVPGFGMDVRPRRIWTQFAAQGTTLRQAALDPSSAESTRAMLLGGDGPMVDFLIGNHSDELTPWIPIMAARLGCNFFLLPCCPYNFFSKFMKQMPSPHLRPSVGGLADQFHAYLRHICTRLGFTLTTDNLRIPSRKKKCFIGVVPSGGLAPNLEQIISELLEEAKTHKDRFTPRPAKEEVRNCSKIPWAARVDLAKRIVAHLIAKNPDENYNGWRCGGSEQLAVINEMVLTAADRQALSRQNKGLQTLLRNFHQVFSVRQAVVSVRRWPELNGEFARKAATNVKRCACWFYNHHPDGCPLTADECSYVH